MRVIMPIFQFQSPLNWNDFTFSVGGLSIRHFDDWGTLTDRAIFSQCDRDNMRLENKGLVAEGNSFADEQYKLDSSLLLMTFRLLADENRLTPFVKYRLCEDESYCTRFAETETHPEYSLHQTYEARTFAEINAKFELLWNAEHTSHRLKNAFFFLYRAFNSFHWVDAFLFYMSALEAFFSRDDKLAATKSVCGRAAKMLNDSSWSYSVIENLYGVRSRIVHGRLEAGRNSNENLQRTAEMEVLAKRCLLKLIELDGLKHYADSAARNVFLAQFD